VRVESLQVQLTNAVHRLSLLKRRAEQLSPEPPKLLHQTLKELELALEQLRVALEELLAQHDELATVRSQLEEERRKYWELFDAAPDVYLVTSADAQIIEANRAAAELLNISQRFLLGKNFAVFVCTERERVLAQARRLAETGGWADWVFSVRPRERAPFDVACRVLASETGERPLRWMIRRITPGLPSTSPTTELSTVADDVRAK
jgi:PAS domain S-box-containing protein